MHKLPQKLQQINGFIEKDGRFWMPVSTLANYLAMTSQGVFNIYSRHQDELVWFTTTNKMCVVGKHRGVRMFDEQGCYIVAMLATTEPAKAFRKTLSLFLAQLRQQMTALADFQRRYAAMQTEYQSMADEILEGRIYKYIQHGGSLGRDEIHRMIELKNSGLLTNAELTRLFSVSDSTLYRILSFQPAVNSLQIITAKG